MSTSGTGAEQARRDFRELIEQKGHAVDNARAAMARLEVAFAEGALVRTPAIDQTLADLRLALEQDEGQKLEQFRETIRLTGRIEPERVDPATLDRLLEAFRGWKAT